MKEPSPPKNQGDTQMIPDELKAIDRWLVWRRVPLPDGGINKVPVSKGWNRERVSFEQATRRAARYRDAGLGFYLSNEDDIACIDLDCCRDPASGTITADWAQQVLAAFGPTYVEVSPSGTGVKLWAHGCPSTTSGHRRFEMPGEATGGHRSPALEVFAWSGFCTVTGDRLPTAPSVLATAEAAKPGWDCVRALTPDSRPPPSDVGDDWGRSMPVHSNTSCRA